VARLTLKDVEEDLETDWGEAIASQGNVNEKIVFATGKNSRTVVGTCIGPELIPKLKLLTNSLVRKRAGVVESNKFVFASLGSDEHVSGTSEIRNVCKEAGLETPIPATKVRHYIATNFPKTFPLKESEKPTYYEHFGHSERINKNNYQCFPALEEINLVKKIRTLIHHPSRTTSSFYMNDDNDLEEYTLNESFHLGEQNTDTTSSKDMLLETPKRRTKRHLPTPKVQDTPTNILQKEPISVDSSNDKLRPSTTFLMPSTSRKLEFNISHTSNDHPTNKYSSMHRRSSDDLIQQPENSSIESDSESPIQKKRKLDSDENSFTDTGVIKKHKKTYRKWSDEDNRKIRQHFKSHIQNKVFRKPSTCELKMFVKNNKLSFFSDCGLTPQKCTELMRKLYNENKLHRENILKFEGSIH